MESTAPSCNSEENEFSSTGSTDAKEDSSLRFRKCLSVTVASAMLCTPRALSLNLSYHSWPLVQCSKKDRIVDCSSFLFCKCVCNFGIFVLFCCCCLYCCCCCYYDYLPYAREKIMKENLICYLPKGQVEQSAEEFETHNLNVWCMPPLVFICAVTVSFSSSCCILLSNLLQGPRLSPVTLARVGCPTQDLGLALCSLVYLVLFPTQSWPGNAKEFPK